MAMIGNQRFTLLIVIAILSAGNQAPILRPSKAFRPGFQQEINMSKQHSLEGKVALVQGGSRGIGAAIVRRLAREGAQVAFTYVSSAGPAQELVEEITRAGGKALAMRADSADAAAVQLAVDDTVKAFGRLD
ncbi:3-ketoacyl-ACP reductase, partial [Pseudomonas taiwanensis SJ9]